MGIRIQGKTVTLLKMRQKRLCENVTSVGRTQDIKDTVTHRSDIVDRAQVGIIAVQGQDHAVTVVKCLRERLFT
jgi:hypothetical protein